jgi:DMSO/TMAO reductase YedYZ heme-binding membrane subunit
MTFSKQLFRNLLIALILIIIAFTVYAGFNFSISNLYESGKIFGYLSALMFCLVLIPGITRRLKIKNEITKTISGYIMFARAQVGLAMFFFGLGHYIMLMILPVIVLGLQPNPKVYVFFGLMALFLSLWLALTSNQFSKKLLKKNWGRLHSLVYVIVWLLFIHTALIEISPISILLLIFAVVESYSLIKVRFLDKKVGV